MVVRLGSGGFGQGYSSSLEQDDGQYAVVRVGGRKVHSIKPQWLKNKLSLPAKLACEASVLVLILHYAAGV